MEPDRVGPIGPQVRISLTEGDRKLGATVTFAGSAEAVSYGHERVLSHFDAYDANGTRYVIEEYVAVHDWVQGDYVPVEWAGVPRLRLADRTPVERGPRDRLWFRDGRGRDVDLTLHNPREG